MLFFWTFYSINQIWINSDWSRDTKDYCKVMPTDNSDFPTQK